MKFKITQFLVSLATFVPGVNQFLALGKGGTGSARYCYSVWLRHLVMAKESGLNTQPKIIAELGPGDSLGIGLAALISGSEKYYAFDVVEHANLDMNLRVFDELVVLFTNKAVIPADDEFPSVKPRLENYEFPADILDKNRLSFCLGKERLAKIRSSISNYRSSDSVIQYKVPWSSSTKIEKESVDMIYSQAVLEHVADLRSSYNTMSRWLKKSGFMSHQIDYKCHGTAKEWNGHWTYSDLFWGLIRGNRSYSLNRQPHSTHLKHLNEFNFHIVSDKKVKSPSILKRKELAPRFRHLTDDDLLTSGAFLQSVKEGSVYKTSGKQ